jgi:hypothetical protein
MLAVEVSCCYFCFVVVRLDVDVDVVHLPDIVVDVDVDLVVPTWVY